MLKSVDVAIPMQQISEDVKMLFPNEINWDEWRLAQNDFPFAENVIEFLNALSKSILNDKQSREFPDVVTFAFFCRKANLIRLKEKYYPSGIRIGRGILFHIAPSNVPINFAYSLVAGLLSGNNNIVRVSSKYFPQIDLVLRHIHNLSLQQEFSKVLIKMVIVQYPRTSKATDYFSSFCNTRIIWGGDETIAMIRKSHIPPRSFDITFADRYSLAAINADKLVEQKDLAKIAYGFYNDTYLFDQNACTAPHLIIWLGSKKNIEMAKIRFWDALRVEIEKKYEFQSVLAVDKLTAFYRQAIAMPIKKQQNFDNKLFTVDIDKLSPDIDLFRCVGGYFSEYTANSLSEIADIVKNNYQTLAYYGFEQEELKKFINESHLNGIDRIVPMGQTTDFSLTWDGYNLIETLTRECVVI